MRTPLAFCALLSSIIGLVACSSDASDSGRQSNGIGAAGTIGGASNAGAAAAPAAGAAGTPGTGAAGLNFGQQPVQPMLTMDLQLPEESCARADITASRVVPTVMLLVDGSGSMVDNCYPAGLPTGDGGARDPSAPCVPAIDGQPSRWDAIRGALSDPGGFVAQLQDVVKFGLAVYGTTPTCPLPLGIIEPAIGNASTITASLPVAAPGLTTPTGLALEQIVPLLPDPTQALDEVIGPQIIILATDGDPNSCDLFDLNPSLEASVNAALAAKAKHLQLYVIGVGNDSTAAHLQELANIGAGMDRAASPGAPVYYPEDPQSLSDTLRSLVGDAISCELQLDGKGVQMGKECKDSVVTLNGNPLECNGADGWRLKSSTVIELQGAACAQLQSDLEAQLSANFPCDVLVE